MKITTLQELQEKLDDLKTIVHDNEVAHRDERAIHTAVLRSIAEGSCDNAERLAALALTSEQIEFNRWYA